MFSSVCYTTLFLIWILVCNLHFGFLLTEFWSVFSSDDTQYKINWFINLLLNRLCPFFLLIFCWNEEQILVDILTAAFAFMYSAFFRQSLIISIVALELWCRQWQSTNENLNHAVDQTIERDEPFHSLWHHHKHLGMMNWVVCYSWI